MPKKEKSAAILTVYGISDMTSKGRRDVVKWLNNQIKNIQKYHHVKGEKGFAKRYTARYLYV